MRHVLFWVLGLGLLQSANAQEAQLPLDETYAVANLEEGAPDLIEPPPEGPKKIPDAALGLSMGLTALSFIVGGELAGVGKNTEIQALQIAGLSIAASGVILFPSAGYVYAEDAKHMRTGLIIRTSAVLASGALLLLSAQSDSTAVDAVVFGAAGVMGAVTLLSATLDVAGSEDATRRYNERSR